MPHTTRFAVTPLARLAAPLLLLTTACASASLKTGLTGADRPGYTYGTATVPRGGVQAEVGYTDTRAADVTYQSLGEGLLRIGAGPNTEVRLFSNSYALSHNAFGDDNGLEDVKLGLKQRVWAGKGTTGFSGASIALLPAASIPTGSTGFSAETWQPELLVAAALPLTAKFSLVANVGDQYVKIGPDRENKLLGTLAGWLTVSSKVSLFGEYGGTKIADGGTAIHYFDTGIAIVPVPAIQLDLRVGHGANGVKNDNYIGVGLVRRF